MKKYSLYLPFFAIALQTISFSATYSQTDSVSRVSYQGASSVFMMAAKSNNIAVLDSCIQAGVDVNSQTQKDGYTALCFAAHINQLHTAEYLISKGANVNLSKPIIVACEQKNWDMVKLLVKYGADINSSAETLTGYEEYTPLMFAVLDNNVDMVKYIISLPTIKVNMSVYVGNTVIKSPGETTQRIQVTALDLAKKGGNKEILNLLNKVSK